jgi:hypothetical protein
MRLRSRHRNADGVHLFNLSDLATNMPDFVEPATMPTTVSSDPSWARVRRWTIGICAGLLMVFAALAWSAVKGKSPTADEGYHAMAGWLHLWKGEYRFDSEDPPLWNTLAAIVTGPGTIRVDMRGLDWSNLPLDAGAEYKWQIQTLFRTAGNDPISFIARFRAVMLAVGVALGASIAYFVWRVARSCNATPMAAGAATVLATGLFAIDPNFLAHSPLMKNDVASALALLGLTACTREAGRVLTLRRIVALGIWSSIAMTVKFNGPLLVGSAAVLLFLRAVSRWPWRMGGRRANVRLCDSRLKRVQATALTLAVMGTMMFATIWISYGLRFAPSPDRGAQLNMPSLTLACLINSWEARHWDGMVLHPPTKEQGEQMPRPAIVRFVGWADERHVLPQSFLAGLLYVFQASQTRGTFLCGQSGNSIGAWWYFPFAMAVKTPVATLAALAATAMAVPFWLRRCKGDAAISDSPSIRVEIWTALCLGVPVAIYLGAAMSANLNLGLRHVFPVYPLLFVAMGLAMARLWDWRRAPAMLLGTLVLAALAIESFVAYPDYIPFFNAMAGGSRSGLRLLSDSNLDWGQDLPLLAKWQQKHPDQKLYLAYFGTADPAYYGIRYTNVTDGYWYGPAAQPINSPGVLAISATTLQGPYAGHTFGVPTWSMLWKFKPFEVLGGSIYLFHVPATQADRLPPGTSLIN